MTTLPVATVAALANTTSKSDNLPNPLLAKIAAPTSTTNKLDNPCVKIAALASTTIKQEVLPKPIAKSQRVRTQTGRQPMLLLAIAGPKCAMPRLD